MSGFVVVIPSRYASTRLPGKPLRTIAGKPMLQHVHERASASAAREVIVATDDERIATAAEAFGARVCMTGDQHRSGTERIAEVADLLDWDDATIVVNLQGDEPAMPPALIDQCARLLNDSRADLSTLASPLRDPDARSDPNVVKVVCDERNNALYFSRAAIPFDRSGDTGLAQRAALHHHGIYAYRCGVLRALVGLEPTAAECAEQLEQLRALGHGYSIRVGIPAVRPGPGVDTEADIARAEVALAEFR